MTAEPAQSRAAAICAGDLLRKIGNRFKLGA
jgi:hypothetical protein